MFDLISRLIDVDGVSLAITEAGAGGRPLLLVHGFTGAKEDFGDHIDTLAAAGNHVVALDHRGHGESDMPDTESGYSFEIMAADVIGVADALGWDRFALLGHSMGGMIVQVVADLIPHRIERLVLMDTSHGSLPFVSDALVAMVRDVIASGGMDALADALAAGGGPLETEPHQRVTRERPGYKEWGERKLRSTSPVMYLSMLAAFGGDQDRIDSLKTLTMPTLVICGECDDPFIGPSRNMSKAIPNAELVMIPDAGHCPQFENPDVWFNALEKFLSAA